MPNRRQGLRPRAESELWGIGGIAVAIAIVLAATVGVTQAADPAPIRPKIMYPTGEHPVCGGSVELLGAARRSRALGRHGRIPHARWRYSSGGRFHRIHGQPLPLTTAGVPILRTQWNARHVPQGRTRLRLKIGRHSRVASSSFRLDRRPVIGPVIAKVNRETGLVTLSAPRAHDPGHPARVPALEWFLGDGTRDQGRTAQHVYEPGDYVVDVTAEDDDGCTRQKVVDLSVPVGNDREELSEVDWCDPLKVLMRKDGKSFAFWPPDVGTKPESKDPPEKVELGRRKGGGFAIAFGFETRMQVLGNPEKCTTRQVIRARYVWEDKKEGTQVFRSPFRPGYTDDGYNEDYRFRKTAPSGKADGTSEIEWVDFPSVKADDNITNAQVKATFIDVVKGQEAPIDHTEDEGDGESAFVRFTVCAALDPPAGQKDSDFTEHERKEPDAKFPEAAKKENLREDNDYLGPGKDKITGCGEKK